MALVQCGDCGKPVSTSATACPACGAPPPKEPARGSKGQFPVLLTVVSVVLVAAVIATCTGRGASDSARSGAARASAPPSTAESANTTCRYFLRQQLPKGSDIVWGEMNANTATQQGEDRWRVVLVYQVLHAGGTRVSTCRVKRMPGDNWQLLGIE